MRLIITNSGTASTMPGNRYTAMNSAFTARRPKNCSRTAAYAPSTLLPMASATVPAATPKELRMNLAIPNPPSDSSRSAVGYEPKSTSSSDGITSSGVLSTDDNGRIESRNP